MKLSFNSRIISFSVILSLFLFSAYSLKNGYIGSLWDTLLKVKWAKKYSKEFKGEVDYPIFTTEIKQLNGKEITISGYIVPVDMYGGDDSYCILSAYPASSCFFCGQAGPESVMEVYSKNKKLFYGSKFTVKGRLKLNPDNPDHLIYILEDAVQVKD